MDAITFPTIYIAAMRASIEASREIMTIYSEEVIPDFKADGSPVTRADLIASAVIYEHLKSLGIPLIGEERTIAPFSTRKHWSECWSVDPLDGTKMFLRKNDQFSVNIAHIVDEAPHFGVIASPTDDRMIIGGPNFGASILNFSDIDHPEKWRPLLPAPAIASALRVIGARNFAHSTHPQFETWRNKFGELTYLNKGSALKFFELAQGNADVYLRFHPTMEWDIAAGHAILKALGGNIFELNGTDELTYNKEHLHNPAFIARTSALMS